MAKLNKTVPAKTPIIPVTLITRPMMISFFAITDLPLRFGNHSSHKATSSAPPDAPLHVWMAPAWQEITSRAAQKSLAVMCPACSRSPEDCWP